jgi:hypothetical protein
MESPPEIEEAEPGAATVDRVARAFHHQPPKARVGRWKDRYVWVRLPQQASQLSEQQHASALASELAAAAPELAAEPAAEAAAAAAAGPPTLPRLLSAAAAASAAPAAPALAAALARESTGRARRGSARPWVKSMSS